MSKMINFVQYKRVAKDFITQLQQSNFPGAFGNDIQQIILDVQTLDLQLRLLDNGNCYYSSNGLELLEKRLEACRAALVQVLDDSDVKAHNNKIADDISKTKSSMIAATQTCSIIMQSVVRRSAES